MRSTGGFLLAATVADDDAAATARAGLAGAWADRVAPEAQALAARPPEERRTAIRGHAASLRRPPRGDSPLPPRARGLLAAEMPKDVGRIWLAAAPRPRRGWSAPAALREVLRRSTHEARPADPDLADRERGAGRELVARHLREADEAERNAVLDALGAEEAAAVLALDRLLDAEDAGVPAEVARAVVHAVRARRGLPEQEHTRAAGAMALGWRATAEAGADGDVFSRRFWRAGAELRALWEAGCRG